MQSMHASVVGVRSKTSPVLYTALYSTLYCTVNCTVQYTALYSTLHCTVHCTVQYTTLYSKTLLKYNTLSEDLYELMAAVYMDIDEEKTNIWILQCKMCWYSIFLFCT